MRGVALLGAGIVVLSACAAGGAARPPTPKKAMSAAVDALHRGDVGAAAQSLEQVVAGAPGGSLERRALLLGAVVNLHPRNPKRSPDRAAELAARLIGEAADPWASELGLALYEVALDLGANPSPSAAGGTLPRPPRDLRSGADRIQRLEREIERLQRELTRIRETLKQ